jgi:acetyltransferase EpsM
MRFIIIGHGGHSKVITDMLLTNPRNKIVGYLDNKYKEIHFNKNQIYGPILWAKVIAKYYEDIKFIFAIGDNKARQSIVKNLNLPIKYYSTITHPSATLSPSVKLGFGTVVMPHAVINADAIIGDHCIINSGAVVEHDCVIEDFVHVCPHSTLTGSVQLAEGVLAGAGSTIIPKVKIGKWATIGAGATVTHNIPSYCTAVGIPAKVKSANQKSVERGVLIDQYS